jgi:signal transduction histidine kinase
MTPFGLVTAAVATTTFAPVAAVLRTDLTPPRDAPPVAVRGTVTYLKLEGYRNLVVQDDTGGLFVRTESVPLPNGLAVGSVVEVRGDLVAGFFAPRVQAREIVVLGRAALPAPVRVGAEEFLSGRFDSRRVEVEGVVRSAARDDTMAPPQLVLRVATPAGPIEAVVLGYNPGDGPRLIDATVRVRGVCVAWDNGRLQLRGFRVGVNDTADVIVVRPADPDPFRAPLVSPIGMTRYRPEGVDTHRVRLRGVTTRSDPADATIIQVGAVGVRVRATGPPPRPGDEVEAVGFPEADGIATDLGNAVVRVVGRGRPPDPMPMSPADPFAKYVTDNLYLRLVRVRGELKLTERTRDGVRLYLERDGVAFQAEFPPGEPAAGVDDLRPGCELELTGVCELRPPPRTLRLDGRPDGFVLLLRYPTDVVVTRPGPWLTPARLRTALGVAAAAAALAVAWALALRRLVARRTAQLVREVAARHDVEVETRAVAAERVRVAAELHDTLEQSLTGVALQLQAAALAGGGRPDRAADHLTLARTLLDRGRHELRASVQDLRAGGSVPTDSLPAELDEVARGMSSRSGPAVAVLVSGEPRPLPEHVAHQALRVAQEAITNAAKHADATTVAVRLEYARDALTLSVQDDGRGFDPAAAGGGDAGHYGLTGMRDRAKKLNADLAVRSAPGSDTTVTLRVPLPPERGGP